MNRLTDRDKNWGPFTLAPWKGYFSFTFSTGDEEEEVRNRNHILLIAFGWALRIALPNLIPPYRQRVEANWDEATVSRLGRNYYFNTDEREFGFSLSNMGNGYDFLQIRYGRQTHDSSTDKSWCTHLPWKQWDCVRNSVYTPTGELFATESRRKGRDFREWWNAKEKCPCSYFGFEDFDGEMIVATCRIEEMEWRRGEGWFSWLKWFWPAKIRRSLDLQFSAEVGLEKGSWKGGTIGHGIEMLPGETPGAAFMRYCQKEHDARHGKKYRIRFIGPCSQPEPKKRPTENDCGCAVQDSKA